MRIRQDEKRMFEEKKKRLLLTTTDIATMLGITPSELYRCSVGQEVTPDVYEAVKEWISE